MADGASVLDGTVLGCEVVPGDTVSVSVVVLEESVPDGAAQETAVNLLSFFHTASCSY